MARLTILQASQQGFGSTLTIHRHIKDGSLPIYEEGDVKLLEVDDLIALFGEPGIPVNDNQIDAEPAEIDIYEYNRMKSDLDQKNKKNMWLAADLAEVVRELKEKEAKFDAERARLLKILEQAQALLLREAKRAGAGVKNADVSSLKIDQLAASGGATDPAHQQGSTAPKNVPIVQAENDVSHGMPASQAGMSLEESPKIKSEDSAEIPAVNTVSPETADSDPSPEILSNAENAPPTIVVDKENRPTKRARSKIGVDSGNPLTPPPEEEIEETPKSRLMGLAIFLCLFVLAGGGFIFYKFRTMIISSIAEIMKVLVGV